jgi:hypothetical protein
LIASKALFRKKLRAFFDLFYLLRRKGLLLCVIILHYTHDATKEHNMKLFKNTQNGIQVQVEFKGDINKIIDFVSSYNGKRIAFDLFNQDFVTSMTPTGVTMDAQ